jgi:hypothetical protein
MRVVDGDAIHGHVLVAGQPPGEFGHKRGEEGLE